MRSGHGEWPRTGWELSAPESYELLNGPNAPGAEAFKLAVLELVAKGSLQLTQVRLKGLIGRRKRVSVLAQGGGSAVHDARPMREILELFRRQPTESFDDGTVGVTVGAFARAASRHFGSIGKYTSKVVAPALESRGLYRLESYRILWIFPASRWGRTGEGQAAQADLRDRMELARREFGGWVRGDPSRGSGPDLPRAIAFTGLAGASLLLASDLYPDLQDLQRELERARAGGAGGYTTSSSADGGGESDWDVEPDLPGIDLGGLDLSALSFEFDLSAFESIDDAFSAIDSGVDSGGGGDGGGGDGGGGDGGGGGGD